MLINILWFTKPNLLKIEALVSDKKGGRSASKTKSIREEGHLQSEKRV
jgi:hypothetical protein